MESVESFIARKAAALNEKRESIDSVSDHLINIDKELIKELGILRAVMKEAYEKYRDDERLYSFAKLGTIIVTVVSALLFRKNYETCLSLGTYIHREFEYASQANEATNNQNTRQVMNDLETYAKQHDQKATELKQKIKNYEYVLTSCREMKLPKQEIKKANMVSQASLSIIPLLKGNVLGANLCDNIVIMVSAGHGICAFIEAVQKIRTIEEIHPLTQTVNKFIVDLNNEIVELRNRFTAEQAD